MRVIWSFGQDTDDFFHRPDSGLEVGTASNTMFYKPDEIKYHGGRNRGATSLNFFGEQVVSLHSHNRVACTTL